MVLCVDKDRCKYIFNIFMDILVMNTYNPANHQKTNKQTNCKKRKLWK